MSTSRKRLKAVIISISLMFTSMTYAVERNYHEQNSVTTESISNKMTPSRELHFDSVRGYIDYLEANDINLNGLNQNGIPAIYCKDLPLNMKSISGETRKNTFIMIMLPIIKKVNNEIRGQRNQLISLHQKQEKGIPLSAAQSLWLENLANKYDVSNDNYNALLQRVNIVPASLVLAQSIQESGWGTSSTARHDNAIFGQHRSAGNENYSFTSEHAHFAGYNTIYNSVSAYIHNLNTNPAYRHLRESRAIMHDRGEPISGYQLAQSLTHYSRRGEYYIHDLHRLIRNTDLERYNDMSMSDNPPVNVSFQYV